MAVRARERLLETAEELFYAEGIHAVGVERILSESGVGRASFYRHFASKEELVVAVITGRDQRWRAWLRATVEGYGLPAEDRPLAVYDALAERFARADFRGCAFINTMVEAADRASAAHRAAAAHKEALTAYVGGLLADAGWSEHGVLATELVLLVDGALVTALREGSPDAALRAKRMAAAVLAAASSEAAAASTVVLSEASSAEPSEALSRPPA